jgi:hypothetical protein
MTVPLSQNALLHSRDSIVVPLHFSIGVVFKHVLFLDCQHDSLQDVQFDQDEKFPVKEINISSLHVHAKCFHSGAVQLAILKLILFCSRILFLAFHLFSRSFFQSPNCRK